MISAQELDHLDRIRTTTAAHAHRQGLYPAAFGLTLMYYASDATRDTMAAPVLLGAVLLAAAAGYYRHTYGTVIPRRHNAGYPAWLIPALPAAVLVLVVAANLTATPGHLTGGLIFAGALALMGGPPRHRRRHYSASAGALMALTLAPLGVLTPTGEHPFASTDPLWQLMAAGALLVVNGLLDHRALVRSLPRPAVQEQ
ncbi:hypothetical protein [Herbidospora sp. NBRC 101105]|uniref:hypothetical protein n=1 Tax=Herbidospora sp. NBRC 101105 TaxID=3032195 RepID=UPI00249FE21D|nr:hypothetical protein [Herbidospora sp. NBRC 101105]GLX93817.1 hypothetical protein Hesp01_17670 [Herbidospora sp. NBRC 101105]